MAELLVPEYINGVPTFVPYAQDIQKMLKEGCSSIGWEGDPRLYVAPRKGAEGYVVGRLGEDGSKHLICVSKPPHKLDIQLLIMLRDNDTRKHNVLARVDRHNASVERENDRRTFERTAEGLHRVLHGLKKDVGHLY